MRSTKPPTIRLAAVLFLLAACAGTPDVRDLGFWALGWQFTAVQNRLQPAIPPVLADLRARHPGVRAADVPRAFEHDFQVAVLGAPAAMQDRLTRRLIGAFAVSGLPCAAEAQPVRDGDRTVAAFVVLDIEKLSAPPRDWTPCPPTTPAGENERVPALRALIGSLMAGQLTR